MQITDKVTQEMKLDLLPLTEMELHMIREVMSDNESVWDEQITFDSLVEKLYNAKKGYLAYAVE